MTKSLWVSFQNRPGFAREIVLREKNVGLRVPPHRARITDRLVPRISPTQEGDGLDESTFASDVRIECHRAVFGRKVCRGLHPEDAARRRVNPRAWTDYVPTFAEV